MLTRIRERKSNVHWAGVWSQKDFRVGAPELEALPEAPSGPLLSERTTAKVQVGLGEHATRHPYAGTLWSGR